jgi:hypothetical protein
MMRQLDLTARMTSSAETPQEQGHTKCIRNGLRQKGSLVIPAPATATPVERHGNHSVELATPLGRDLCHQGAENPAEVAAASVLEAVDRVGDGPTILEDRARRPSGLDEGPACITEDSSALLFAANAPQRCQQLDQTLQHAAHSAVSAT